MSPTRGVGRDIWLPLLLLSLAGWAALLCVGPALFLPGVCGPPADDVLGWDWQAVELVFLLNPPSQLILPWLVMLLAMMPPLLALPLAQLSRGCSRLHLILATGLFATGYLAVWIPAGFALMAAAVMLKAGVGDSAPGIALGIALLWQLSPLKRNCLRACRRGPSPASRLWAPPMRYGSTNALRCLGTCWALMLVPLVAGQEHLLFMFLVSAFLVFERQFGIAALPRRAGCTPS